MDSRPASTSLVQEYSRRRRSVCGAVNPGAVQAVCLICKLMVAWASGIGVRGMVEVIQVTASKNEREITVACEWCSHDLFSQARLLAPASCSCPSIKARLHADPARHLASSE